MMYVRVCRQRLDMNQIRNKFKIMMDMNSKSYMIVSIYSINHINIKVVVNHLALATKK